MKEHKPKLKDIALAAQTAGRQAEHAIDGVRELREEIDKCKKDITQLRYEMFADKEIERLIVKNDFNTIKPDSSISSIGIDASYMVTVEDLMARIKSRDERIEALKQENNQLKEQVGNLESDNDDLEKDINDLEKLIDMYIDAKNDLYLSNLKLNEQHCKMEAEIRRLNEDVTTLNKENGELKKGVLVDWLTKKCSELETKNEELKQGVEKLKYMEKFFDKYFKSLTPDQNTVIGYLGSENDILEKDNEKLKLDNTVLESDNDFLRHEIDEYKDKINVLKDEKRNLQKEKEELKKALNIYQNITDLDVTLTRNTAYVRFIDSDDAGRAMVKGDALDALCDAYLKYYDGFRKEKKDEENK